MQFGDMNQSHGIYDISTFGSLIRIRACGGWNEPTAKQFAEDYKNAVSALPADNWTAFFDLRKWGLAIPEALPFLNELGSWPAPQGTGTHVFLFNNMMIQERIIASILNVTNHDSFFFTRISEAADWISQNAPDAGDPLVILETACE